MTIHDIPMAKLYFWAQRPHSFYLIHRMFDWFPLQFQTMIMCTSSVGKWFAGHPINPMAPKMNHPGRNGWYWLGREERRVATISWNRWPERHGTNGSSVFLFLLKSNQNATILWLDRLNPIIAQLLTPIQKSTILVLKPMVICGTPHDPPCLHVSSGYRAGEGPHWIIWMDIHT